MRHGAFLFDGAKANFPGEELRHGTTVPILGRTTNREAPIHIRRLDSPFEFLIVSDPNSRA